MRELISLHEARERGLTRYYTGTPCSRGHLAERRVSSRGCVECAGENKKVYQDSNKDRVAAAFKNWYERNREHNIARTREWQATNPDKVRQHDVTRYERHRARIIARATTWNRNNRETNYAAIRRWRIHNKARLCNYAAVRRGLKGRATPAWLSDEQQAELLLYYTTAQAMTEAIKHPYEVDHEIPLNSPYVCGLHVPWNLQILPQQINRIKSNKVDN